MSRLDDLYKANKEHEQKFKEQEEEIIKKKIFQY